VREHGGDVDGIQRRRDPASDADAPEAKRDATGDRRRSGPTASAAAMYPGERERFAGAERMVLVP